MLQSTHPHTQCFSLPTLTPSASVYPPSHPVLQSTHPHTQCFSLPTITPSASVYPPSHPVLQSTHPHTQCFSLPTLTPSASVYPPSHPVLHITKTGGVLWAQYWGQPSLDQHLSLAHRAFSCSVTWPVPLTRALRSHGYAYQRFPCLYGGSCPFPATSN